MKISLWKRMLALLLIQSILSVNLAYAGIWQREEEHWTYQENGAEITGWFNESGTNWYYFNQDGLMQTGWYIENQQHRYYLNTAADGTEGLMRTGWFLQNGAWYFLSPIHDGFYGHAITDCWQWIDGYCYLFDSNGVMYANCTTPDGYTVNQSGQWTVNGVVQYIPGKGILTKSIPMDSSDTGYTSHTNNESNSSSGSNGNTNANPPSDDNGNTGTKPPSGDNGDTGTKPPSGDNGDTGTKPPSGDSGNTSGSENTGIITIKYIETGTDNILGEKTVSGKNGDLYIVHHPSIENYKILDNQPDEAFFSSEEQIIEISYRPKQPNEAPDYSIVLNDHLKALIPNNAQEEALIQSIYTECISYNILDEETVEMAVTEDNPLLSLIKNGTYESGDIIYIEPCDTFPIGLSLEYIEHNDSYSEPVDGYDDQQHEIIHARRLEALDLFEEGTYIEYNFKDIASMDDIKAYTDLMDWGIDEAPEKSVRKTRVRQDSNNHGGAFDINLDLTKKDSDSSVLSAEAKVTLPNLSSLKDIDIKVPITLNVDTLIKDIKIERSLGGDDNSTSVQFNSHMTLTVEPNLTFTDVKFSLADAINSPNNKKKIGFWGIQVEGIDLEDIALLGALVIAPFNAQKIMAPKVENVISNYDKEKPSTSNTSYIIPGPLITIFPTLKLNFEADGTIKGKIVFESFVDIDTTRKGDIVQYYKDSGHTKSGCNANGNFTFGMEKIDATWGGGILAGVAIGGIMPIGIHLNGAFEGNGKITSYADFNLFPEPNSDSKFTLNAPKEDIELSLTAGVYLDTAIRLAAEIGGSEVEGEGKHRFTLFEDLIFKYPFSPYDLIMGEPVTAVDWKGKNISKNWEGFGYDPSIEMVTTYQSLYGESYKCPQYIKPINSSDNLGNDNDNIHEVKTVRVLSSDYGMLDISEALGVESVSIPTGIKLLVFKGNGTAFPDSGTWYSDEEKKNPVSTCGKNKLIFSEWYQPDSSGVQLYLTGHTQIKGVDASGTNISKNYNGYNSLTGMIEPYSDGDGISFQCPYYMEDTDPLTYQRRPYKVSSILVSDMFETLDISKAACVTQVTIGGSGSLSIFIGNGKSFPDKGKWYSDKDKTKQVTSCNANQTIYSEWYKPSSTLQSKQTATLAPVATPSNASPRPSKVPADIPVATSSNAQHVK